MAKPILRQLAEIIHSLHTEAHTHELTGWSYVFSAVGGWTVINCSSFLSCCFRRTLPCLDCKYIHLVLSSLTFSFLAVHFSFLFVFFIVQATKCCSDKLRATHASKYNKSWQIIKQLHFSYTCWNVTSILSCLEKTYYVTHVKFILWFGDTKWTGWGEIVGPSGQVICSFSEVACLWENPLVTGRLCDTETWTKGHIRLWTVFQVKGCLFY